MKPIERAVVVTTINLPTPAITDLARRSSTWPLIVIGDRKTPATWAEEGATFVSLEAQQASSYTLQGLLPLNHYSRKNLGYLEAISRGAVVIAETDDDNRPNAWPPEDATPKLEAGSVDAPGWVNIYKYFTDETIWARGLPLEEIQQPAAPVGPVGEADALVHQYLAEGDPDVDAIYRLTVGKMDHRFTKQSIVLAPGSATPFNSQCTIWFGASLPLLYLPSFVSFRMTDIWRSYVAQVCLWAFGASIAYRGDGVWQDRNAHNLHRDFLDEVVGYQRNDEIMKALTALTLSDDPLDVSKNLRACYEELVRIGVVPVEELALVDAWVADLNTLGLGTGAS